MHSRFIPLLILAIIGLFTGCETTGSYSNSTARVAMTQSIQTEPAGDYYIGRRYYKNDYKFWGYIRSPGQPWSTARLVMLNEQGKLAPDRETGKLGSDNNYEYKLTGNFSEEPVYEPASNGIYPEFVLRGYELRSVTPAQIYKTPGATDPARRIIAKPY